MSNHKLSNSSLSVVAVSLVVGLVLLPLSPAQSVTFEPKGSPEKTAGGASRGGSCLESSEVKASQQSLAALVPATDGELTADAYPTIFVNVPQSQPLNAEFTFWDENSMAIYQTTVPLTGTPGIISFKLPNSAGPLAIGKRYKWTVALSCDDNDRTGDVVVQGWLQRAEVNSALSTQLNSADPLQKAKLYAQNRFWYNTVAILIELRRSRPGDVKIAAEWQELLQSVGLTQFSQAYLVDCCQAQN
ncbi:MAG TPA: DUF928 domain-containing protein [Kamptonema sp.]|nr:DUF928 domain-containing protein [Kamptonema sp.]